MLRAAVLALATVATLPTNSRAQADLQGGRPLRQQTRLPAAPAVASIQAVTPIPRPIGLYVLDNAANLNPTAKLYPAGLFSDSTYARYVSGHAIFVPIAKIIPSISVWGQFQYNWAFLDTLVGLAVSNGKHYSIELETGLQTSSQTYSQALPAGFAENCGPGCAPLFDVWITGGTGGSCTSSYVLLP
jgi:hypothetical protein